MRFLNSQKLKSQSDFSRWAPWIVFLVVSILYTLPIYKNFQYWGIQDWDLNFFYYELPRLTILQYHQFPLWNPFFFGGVTLIGDLESGFLHPLYLPVLLFGTVPGAKLMITFHVFIALAGTYVLARHLGLSSIPRYITAFTFGLSTIFSLQLASGVAVHLSYTYYPWILYCVFRSFKKPLYVFGSSLLLALIFLSGGAFTFVSGVMLVALVFVLYTKALGWKKMISLLLITLLLTAMFAAIKLGPSLQQFSDYPRLTERVADKDGYSLKIFIQMLVCRDQSLSDIGKYYSQRQGFWNGMDWFMDENGMYVGFLVLILFSIGLVKDFRRHWRLAVLFFVFVWLSFGFRCPLSLWALLHEFPIFDSMRCPMRFRMVFLMFLALFAGFGTESTANFFAGKMNMPRFQGFIFFLLAAFVCIDMILVSRPIWQESFQIPPAELSRKHPVVSELVGLTRDDKVEGKDRRWPADFNGDTPPFIQIEGLPQYDKEGYNKILNGEITLNQHIRKWDSAVQNLWRGSDYLPWSLSSQYLALLHNFGTIDAQATSMGKVPKNAVPISSAEYRGELYLVGCSGVARYTGWSPNRLSIQVHPDRAGLVVINQNYYPGWKVAAGPSNRIVNYNGLLAVELTSGDNYIEIYYHPVSFFAGALISLATLTLAVVLLLKQFRRRLSFVQQPE